MKEQPNRRAHASLSYRQKYHAETHFQNWQGRNIPLRSLFLRLCVILEIGDRAMSETKRKAVILPKHH